MAELLNSMRVLVTRPLPDSQRTAQLLAGRGHEAVIVPLFEIRIFAGPELLLDGVQAVLATSVNGVRALAQRCERRDVKLLAVGTETAAVARNHGFIDVADAAGDARLLALMVRDMLLPDAGRLLHVRGAAASPDPVAKLAGAGFVVRSEVLYETVDAPELPGTAASALRNGTLDAVLVFSPRSAWLLADRVGRAGLSSACKNLQACCISAATADALRGLTFAGVRVASHPDQESLLALLEMIGGWGAGVQTMRSG
jgi:uroporphyrinogen-III synthase